MDPKVTKQDLLQSAWWGLVGFLQCARRDFNGIDVQYNSVAAMLDEVNVNPWWLVVFVKE